MSDNFVHLLVFGNIAFASVVHSLEPAVQILYDPNDI